MYCTQCGASNSEESSFCQACGKPLVGAPVVEPAPAPAPKGNLGQAWADITGSPNWIKRLLLLMVMNCVPVLDLYVKGYALQWGSQAARGKSAPLTQGAFDKKAILFGLVPFLLGILLGLGTTILYAFALIPFVGWIATVVGSIMAGAFYYMAVMRVGATGKMSSAFDLSELFRAYRKNPGGLIFATVIPSLIAIVVVGLFGAIVLGIAGAGAYSSLNDMSYYYYYYYGYNYAMVLSLMASLGFALVLVIVVALFMQGFVVLWTMRAVGYWVHKNAPEWAEEGVDSENPFKATPQEVVE